MVNRQERRNKKKPSQVLDKSAAWLAIEAMMFKGRTEQQDSEVQMMLIAPAYAALEALTGTTTSKPWLDKGGYVYLCEMSAFCFMLAKRIYESAANDETKEAVRPAEAVGIDSANAIALVGERFQRTGKYRANGDELKAIRECFHWLDSLLAVSTQGVTLSALVDASRMVDSKLHKLGNN
jgi:hypothetical protein